MYHAIVTRIVRSHFERHLSNRNDGPLLAGVAPDVVHEFAGRHALGGTRHSRAAMQAWFERLFRLFPVLVFETQQIAVAGWPWSTVVTVRWRNRGEGADGGTYEGSGCHVINLRWGRARSIRAYLDTAALIDALNGIAEHGIAEATAAPIVDEPAPPALARRGGEEVAAPPRPL